jgi:CBS domain-containing protein
MNNILLFLLPKKDVEYVLDTFTVRQCLEKMDYHHYSAIPVLDKEGHYLKTISDGDLLRTLRYWKFDNTIIQKMRVGEILFVRSTQAINVEKTMDELVELIIQQNFVPVVDDRNFFIGIVTRKAVIEYLHRNQK